MTSIDACPSRVTGELYAGVGDPGAWDGILASLLEVTGAVSGCVIATDGRAARGNVNCFRNIDPEWIDAYNAHYHQFDPSPQLMRDHDGKVLVDHVTGPRPADTRGGSRVFYHEVMTPQDFRHTLAIGLHGPGDWHAGFVLQRGPRQGPFEDPAVGALQHLDTPLRHALTAHARIMQAGSLGAGLGAALDRAPAGVVLLDGAGNTAFVNRAAHRLLATSDALRLETGGLHACRRRDERPLQAGIAAALAAARGECAPLEPAGFWFAGPDTASTLRVEIGPIASCAPGDPFGDLQALVAVWLTPLQAPLEVEPAALAEIYALTPTEGELLALLVEGLDAREIAGRRGATLETVRTQIKTVMGKVGASRQPELVRKVLTGPAVLSRCH
jgi:DNA-binding CsgD family transcriptional regulator/PAS domain-containing protein